MPQQSDSPDQKLVREASSKPKSRHLFSLLESAVQHAQAHPERRGIVNLLFVDWRRGGASTNRSFRIKRRDGVYQEYSDYITWCGQGSPVLNPIEENSFHLWLTHLGVKLQQLEALGTIYLQQLSHFFFIGNKLQLPIETGGTEFCRFTLQILEDSLQLDALQILPKTPKNEDPFAFMFTRGRDSASDRVKQLRYSEVEFTGFTITLGNAGQIELVNSFIDFGIDAQDRHLPVDEKASVVPFTPQDRANDLRAMANQLECFECKASDDFQGRYLKGLQKALRDLADVVDSGKKYSHTHELYLKWESYWAFLRLQGALGEENSSDYNLFERMLKSADDLRMSEFNKPALQLDFQDTLQYLLINGATTAAASAPQMGEVIPFSHQAEEADKVAQTYFAFSEIMNFLCSAAENVNHKGKPISHLELKKILKLLDKFDAPPEVALKFKNAVYRYLSIIMYRYLEKNPVGASVGETPRSLYHASLKSQISGFIKHSPESTPDVLLPCTFTLSDHSILFRACLDAAILVEIQNDVSSGKTPTIPPDSRLNHVLWVEKTTWRNSHFKALAGKYTALESSGSLSTEGARYLLKIKGAFQRATTHDSKEIGALRSDPSPGIADAVDSYFLNEAEGYYREIAPGASSDSKQSSSHFKNLDSHFSLFKEKITASAGGAALKDQRLNDLFKKDIEECLRQLKTEVFNRLNDCLGIGVPKGDEKGQISLRESREKLDNLLKTNPGSSSDIKLSTKQGCRDLLHIVKSYADIAPHHSLELAKKLVFSRIYALPDERYRDIQGRLEVLDLNFTHLDILANFLGDAGSMPDVDSLNELFDLFLLEKRIILGEIPGKRIAQFTNTQPKLLEYIFKPLMDKLRDENFSNFKLDEKLDSFITKISRRDSWSGQANQDVRDVITYYRGEINADKALKNFYIEQVHSNRDSTNQYYLKTVEKIVRLFEQLRPDIKREICSDFLSLLKYYGSIGISRMENSDQTIEAFIKNLIISTGKPVPFEVKGAAYRCLSLITFPEKLQQGRSTRAKSVYALREEECALPPVIDQSGSSTTHDDNVEDMMYDIPLGTSLDAPAEEKAVDRRGNHDLVEEESGSSFRLRSDVQLEKLGFQDIRVCVLATVKRLLESNSDSLAARSFPAHQFTMANQVNIFKKLVSLADFKYEKGSIEMDTLRDVYMTHAPLLSYSISHEEKDHKEDKDHKKSPRYFKNKLEKLDRLVANASAQYQRDADRINQNAYRLFQKKEGIARDRQFLSDYKNISDVGSPHQQMIQKMLKLAIFMKYGVFGDHSESRMHYHSARMYYCRIFGITPTKLKESTVLELFNRMMATDLSGLSAEPSPTPEHTQKLDAIIANVSSYNPCKFWCSYRQPQSDANPGSPSVTPSA